MQFRSSSFAKSGDDALGPPAPPPLSASNGPPPAPPPLSTNDLNSRNQRVGNWPRSASGSNATSFLTTMLQPPQPPPPSATSAPSQKPVFLFRHRIQPGGLYRPDAKRYVLYVSDACPFSCRCLAYWAMKNLTQAIQVSMVSPIWQQCPHHQPPPPNHSPTELHSTTEQQRRVSRSGSGMTTSVHLQHHMNSTSAAPQKPEGLPLAPQEYFYLQQAYPPSCGGGSGSKASEDGCSCGWAFLPQQGFRDPLGKFETVADIYRLSMETTGDYKPSSDPNDHQEYDDDVAPTTAVRLSRTAYTLPLLYDTHTNTIVNNCSSDICQLFNDMFNEVARAPEVNLTPRTLQATIRDINKRLVTPITSSIFECGRAVTQLPYEREANALYSRLDEVERILSRQRYLCSSTSMTDCDIRLCTVLVRLDDVYSVCCRCNHKYIRLDYPNIMEWLRDVTQTGNFLPLVANLRSTKAHYFLSPMNPIGPPGGFRIVPQGCGFERYLIAPHRRVALGVSSTATSGTPPTPSTTTAMQEDQEVDSLVLTDVKG